MTADRAAATANTTPSSHVMITCDQTTADRSETVSRASSSADPQPQRVASPETLRLYGGRLGGVRGLVPPAGRCLTSGRRGDDRGVSTEAAATLSAGALARRAAAIAAKHRQSGLTSPASDPAVRAVLRLARASACSQRRISTATPQQPARQPEELLPALPYIV
jgi:hypothetical protein